MFVFIALLVMKPEAAWAVQPAPSISPNYRVYASSPQSVSMSSSDGAATIRYTLDGTDPDGSSPVYSGAFNITSTKTIKAIAIGSQGTSAVTTTLVQIDASAADVINMGEKILWLKADNGALTSGSSVTQWMNMTGSLTIDQPTSANQPTLSTNVLNGLPAVDFDGASPSEQWLSVSSFFGNLSNGCTMYFVIKPESTVNTDATIIDLGNGNNNDIGVRQPNSTDIKVIAYNGTTSSSYTATNAATADSFQLLEVVHNGSAANVDTFKDGIKTGFGPVNTLNNPSRATNYIGKWNDGTGFFNGKIAELIVFAKTLTPEERAKIKAYLTNRYAMTPCPPYVSPITGVYDSGPTYPNPNMTITAGTGSTIHYTTNGDTPTTGSPTYSSSVPIYGSTIIKSIAVQNSISSPVATSYIQCDLTSRALPTGAVAWFRSDYGLTTSGDNITGWADMSGQGYHATQSNGSYRPTVLEDAIQGKRAIRFNGSSQFLDVAKMFSNSFSTGASLFAVTRPSSLTSGATLIDLGNGATSNNISLAQANGSGTGRFHSYNGSSNSYLDASSAFASDRFKLSEVVQDGAGSAKYYVNGTEISQGSVNNVNTLDRASNFLGRKNGGSDYWPGDLAELILYNKALTEAERTAVESYLITKFQLNSVVPSAPKLSLPTSTLGEPGQVAISAEGGCIVYVTQDGTTPTTASPVYGSAIRVNYTQTVKALAVKNGVSSSVSSATYTLDSAKWPAPSAGDSTPLNINLQLPKMASPQ